MKISAIGPQIHFNSSEKNYKETVKEKKDMTVKLAIGTAIAGAGLLAVYYINKKPKKITPKDINTNSTTTEGIKNSIQKTTQTIIGEKGQKIIKKITDNGTTQKIEKLFYNQKGKKIKKQQVTTELIYTVKIPTGYKRTITNFKDDKQTTQRITYLTIDEKPQKTISNGKTIYYFYDSFEPQKIIAHAFSNNNEKFLLKLENEKNFKKQFTNIEDIHKWLETNSEKF